MAKSSLKIKSVKRSALEVSTSRSLFGLLTAKRIAEAASLAGDEIALRVSDKLSRCAAKENLFLGFSMNYEGRAFDGHGVLWGCGLRCCGSCMAKKRTKSRRRAFEVVESTDLRVGEQWRFITLTFPNLPGVELDTSLKILNKAWDYFRKRKIYTENIGVGVKGIEFELGNKKNREDEKRDWSLAEDGFHSHMHLLVASRFINKDDLRREWTACVLKAWGDVGIERSIDTSDGLLITNIKLVDKDVSMSKAVFEVSKYITKSDSWLKLPSSELLSFARACGDSLKGWPRMFEVLGRANGNSGRRRVRRDDIAIEGQSNLENTPVLDTNVLSDGDFVLNVSSDFDIDTKKPVCDSSAGALLAAAAALSLKELAREAPRWIWIYELDRRIGVTQRLRREALASRYPDAKFVTLAGWKWRSNGHYMVEGY